MKGLFIKDIELALVQRKFFLMILIIAIVLSFESVMTGYLIVLSAMFVTTTMSYDEFENGFGYLMTLPIERKDYVKEKYLFGLAITFCAWMIDVVIELIYSLTQASGERISDILNISMLMVSVGLGMIAVMLPFILKFGLEKGRYIFAGIAGGIFGIVYVVMKTAKEKVTVFSDILNSLPGMNMITITLCVLAAVFVLYMISCVISIRIMEKKEF